MGRERGAESSNMNVLVSVDKHHRNKLRSIAKSLESAGMTVADLFETTGMIAGEVASADFSKLRDVVGVTSVEEDQTFHAY
jgi:hypothetical protein